MKRTIIGHYSIIHPDYLQVSGWITVSKGKVIISKNGRPVGVIEKRGGKLYLIPYGEMEIKGLKILKDGKETSLEVEE